MVRMLKGIRSSWRRGRPAAWAVLALLAAGSLSAAEPVKPPVGPETPSGGGAGGSGGSDTPPAAPPGAEPEKKPVIEDVWTFDPADRRDPFSFTRAVVVVEKENDLGPGGSGQGRQGLSRNEVEAKKREAEAAYTEGERALMASDAPDAVSKCDRGLDVFKDVPNIADYRDLQEVQSRLLRLRKAADRLRQRQDAEREFTRLNIRVTGVVARDKRSQAIVNASIVSKGDLVTTGDSTDVVIVEDILPEQVIFLFRGYKMMLTLSDTSR